MDRVRPGGRRYFLSDHANTGGHHQRLSLGYGASSALSYRAEMARRQRAADRQTNGAYLSVLRAGALRFPGHAGLCAVLPDGTGLGGDGHLPGLFAGGSDAQAVYSRAGVRRPGFGVGTPVRLSSQPEPKSRCGRPVWCRPHRNRPQCPARCRTRSPKWAAIRWQYASASPV